MSPKSLLFPQVLFSPSIEVERNIVRRKIVAVGGKLKSCGLSLPNESLSLSLDSYPLY